MDLTPADPGRPDLRVGDAEREAVVDTLRAHYAAGRLEVAEYEDRTAAALQARTRGDLEPLLADLPSPGAKRPGPPVREAKRGDGGLRAYTRNAFLPVALICIVIWLLTTPGGYFWPIWPMFGMAVPMVFMFFGRARR